MNQEISTLALPKNKISILQNLGYHYLVDVNLLALQMGSLNELSCLTINPTTKSAFDLYQEELSMGCILSYNENLDTLLKNEILPKTIVEFTGNSGTGKTQLCFQLCISVQLPKQLGGFGGEALFMSTNKNFSSQRLKDLTNNFVSHINTLKSQTVPSYFCTDYIMKHIYCIAVSNNDELVACIKYLNVFLTEKQVRLVVIDSISYPLKKIDKDRVSSTYKILKSLRELSVKHNFSIIVTNDLTTRVNDKEAYHTPSLGDSYYHLINTRILLDRRNTMFYATLAKGKFHKVKEVYFSI